MGEINWREMYQRAAQGKRNRCHCCGDLAPFRWYCWTNCAGRLNDYICRHVRDARKKLIQLYGRVASDNVKSTNKIEYLEYYFKGRKDILQHFVDMILENASINDSRGVIYKGLHITAKASFSYNIAWITFSIQQFSTLYKLVLNSIAIRPPHGSIHDLPIKIIDDVITHDPIFAIRYLILERE